MADNEHVKEATCKVKQFLNEKNWFTDALAFIESKTGVDRKYLLVGTVTLVMLYFAVSFASAFIVALLGFLYPAYSSVKAIESTNKEDDTQWLTYWVVYSVFSIAEFFSDIILSWFPFYFVFKCAFLGWCMAPFSWNGSEMIYSKVISPFVTKHAAQVEDILADAAKVAKDLSDKAKAVAVDQVIGGGEKTD